MYKIGILGSGKPMMLVETNNESDKLSTEQLAKIASDYGIDVEQIQDVTEEEFEQCTREAIVTEPHFAPSHAAIMNELTMPDISLEPCEYKHSKIRTVTKTDEACYANRIAKRRKKNKNRKTHRK